MDRRPPVDPKARHSIRTPARVYFGHASDPRGLTRVHAIDRAVLPAEGSVVDVKVSPTGRHLVVTVRMPTPGDLAAPTARLLLITRNPEGVADEFTELAADDGIWYGPAAFDTYVEIPDDGSGEEPAAHAERVRIAVAHRVSFAPAL